MNLLKGKKELMILTFANLITQLGITYYVMTNTNVTDTDKTNMKHFALILVEFIIIYALAVIPMPIWLKLVLFSTFSYIFGILLASF